MGRKSDVAGLGGTSEHAVSVAAAAAIKKGAGVTGTFVMDPSNFRNGSKADTALMSAKGGKQTLTSTKPCYVGAMTTRPEREAWMALLHVRPLPGRDNPLDGVSGLGWVLALASDADDYVAIVAAEMERIGLFIAETEDLGPYSEFTSCAEHIADSFERLSNEWPVQYHTFHTTMIDDA